MKDLKKHASLDEQIEKLVQRGLKIKSPEYARKVLFQVNYYRLTGYLYSFKEKEGENYQSVSLEQIMRIYEFDRKFTRILMYALEDIEESLKTRISYSITEAYPLDPLIYTKPCIYRNPVSYQKFLQIFYTSVKNNKELPFIKHHFAEYGGALPMWVAVEIMTMGNLYAIYRNLIGPLQKKIAKIYNTGPVQLESWIENLTYTRNHLAHYMRIWNFKFGRTPSKCSNHNTNAPSTHMLFDQVCIMSYMYSNPSEWNTYVIPAMETLFDEYKDTIQLCHYGFPEDWKSHLIINN